MKKFKINNFEVNDFSIPYLIAELSANHRGKIENVFALIDEAEKNGANAVKIQTYDPDLITLNSMNNDFLIKDGLWKGRYLYDLYKEGQTPKDWHSDMFKYAKEKKITLFSSPFDTKSVDMLESLDCPAYKIASFEITDIPLLEYIGNTKKPVIISTGMATKNEIFDALNALEKGGAKEFAILRCVSGYPANPKDYNLSTLEDMFLSFDVPIGISDHTLDNTISIAGVALGAKIIEKHFTLNRKLNSLDDAFSIEPNELKQLRASVDMTHSSLGKISYQVRDSEKMNTIYRRSLYFVKPLSKGDCITEDSVRSVRPGYGISPKYMKDIIGKKILNNVDYGSPVTFDVIEK